MDRWQCKLVLFSEQNQLLGAETLPQALQFLHGCTDVEIVRRLTWFITSIITNNGLLNFTSITKLLPLSRNKHERCTPQRNFSLEDFNKCLFIYLFHLALGSKAHRDKRTKNVYITALICIATAFLN